LVFEDSDHQVLQWALKPGFGHCWAVQEYRGIWQVFNPSRAYWQVMAFDKLEAGIEEITGGARSVYIERMVDIETIRVPWLTGMVTCVEACKAIIGLRAPWIITPYQLWRWAYEEAEGTEAVRGGEEPAA